MKHEVSLEQRRDYCSTRDPYTCFSTAYEPRPIREHRQRPRRHPPGRLRPLLSDVQSDGRVAWSAQCSVSGDSPSAIGNGTTGTKYDTSFGLPTLTVIRRPDRASRHGIIGPIRLLLSPGVVPLTPGLPTAEAGLLLAQSSSFAKHAACTPENTI